MSYKLRLVLIANFLFLLLLIERSAAQDMHKIDSLKACLETAKEDTLKVNVLNSLSHKIIRIGDPTQAMKYLQQAEQLAEKIFYNKGIASSLGNIGFIYLDQGNYTKALENFFASLQIYKELKNKSQISSSLSNIGLVYRNQGNYTKALEKFIASIKLDEELNDMAGIAIGNNNLGNIYHSLRNYDKALDKYHYALNIFIELGHKASIAVTYNNLGNVYADKGNIEKALENFFASLKILEELKDKTRIATAKYNIGIIYQNQGYYDKALEIFFASLKDYKELDDKLGIAISYTNIGLVYLKQKKNKESRKILLNSLNVAKTIGIKDNIKENYLLLSLCDSILGNWKSAYVYHKLYTQVKDSLFNESSTKAIAEIQTKYETEKKEKEIEVLTKDNELQALQAKQQNDQIQKQWLLIIAIVFILGLAFSLMYVIYSQFKFKKTANEELELKNRVMAEINKELDKKNKSVVESINYAQRIQETIMPTQNQLQKLFPESFIFYKVKDVVSGDFPWVWSSNGNKENIFVSAVDCTGHGVPGAMMSMIGYFLLNEIVNDRKIQMPSEILNHLHEGIKQTLRQEENIESKDGMDIALCTINKELREVQFAGAHRPILWLHKGEIIEVKGNRFPIGGVQYSSRGKEIKFTNHTLKLEKGDSVYFYSDGLIDQLGGEYGKRFRNDRVKKIILENQNKPMQEIHDIMDKEFIKWMGNEKQLDDVLMVGIRM